MGEAREVADRLTDALNAQDLDAIASLYSPEAVYEDPFGGCQGRQQVVENWRAFLTAFPDMSGAVHNKLEVGNTAVDEWTGTGTNTGPLAMPTGETLPATGRSVAIRGADFTEVEGGLVISHRVYFDGMQMLSQLGLAGAG